MPKNIDKSNESPRTDHFLKAKLALQNKLTNSGKMLTLQDIMNIVCCQCLPPLAFQTDVAASNVYWDIGIKTMTENGSGHTWRPDMKVEGEGNMQELDEQDSIHIWSIMGACYCAHFVIAAGPPSSISFIMPASSGSCFRSSSFSSMLAL